MKTVIAIASCAALIAAAISPASAMTTRQRGYQHSEPYRPVHRGFAADPSFGNRAGINYAKQTGRCVADLGYGRFEYCGW